MMNNINFIIRVTNENENADIISIYLIDDDGYSFYAEFNDYNIFKCSNYIKNSIVNNLRFNNLNDYINENDPYTIIYKDCKENLSLKLNNWLKTFKNISFVGNKETYGWYHFLKLISK